MSGYLLTLGVGFLLGFCARNLHFAPRVDSVDVGTTERRQMMIKDGAL